MPFLSYHHVAVACFCLGLALFMIILQGLRNPLSKIPGPWYTRFTRLPLKLAILTGRRIFFVDSLHQKWGPYVRISPDEVAVSDPEGFKQIHRIGTDFMKSDWYRQFTTQSDRLSVFTMTDPKQHGLRRRQFARPMSRAYLVEHWHDTVRDLSRLAVRRMHETGLATDRPVDVLHWWTSMAMDVTGRLMYGHSFENLERGTISEMMQLVTERVIVDGIGVELPILRMVGRAIQFLPPSLIPKLFQAENPLYEHGKVYLASVQASDTSSNIFSNMAAELEKQDGLDERDVQIEASALIVAGTDTTANTLTYLVWAVLSRPSLQKDLEQEVAGLPVDFSDSDAEGLPLLNAVIKEALRMYGAAPGGLPRMVPANGTMMGDNFIPPGTTVTTQAYTFHYDASLFPNPHEFLPSRWLNDEVSDEAKRVFHPFGAGSRICLGMHLANMELRLATAEFFRSFRDVARLAHSVTPESMEMENHFLISPRSHKCEVWVH